MDPILRRSLNAARAGHEGLLAGFGLERYVVYGPAVPPNSRQWEERLTLTGAGVGEFRSLRSITDGCGEPIGYFRGCVSRHDLIEVIGLVDEVGLVDAAPFQIEAADMAIRMTIIVGGIQVVKYLGVKDRERLMGLHPLLLRLQQIEMQLKRTPVRSLAIEMAMPAEATIGVQRVPVNLRFVNRGQEAYWVSHPRSLGRGAYSDRCTLEYGYSPPIRPGVAPMPIEVMETPLRPETDVGLQMIWLGAGAVQESHLLAEVNFHQPGEFLARVVFSNYDGEDAVGGVPRLRGCVFSSEQIVQVRE